jgi:hypothetical protein
MIAAAIEAMSESLGAFLFFWAFPFDTGVYP